MASLLVGPTADPNSQEAAAAARQAAWERQMAEADAQLAKMEAEMGPIEALAGTEWAGAANLPGRCGVGAMIYSDTRKNLDRMDPRDLLCPDCGMSVFEPHCLEPALHEIDYAPDHGIHSCGLCMYRLDRWEYAPEAHDWLVVPALYTPRKHNGVGLGFLRHYTTVHIPVCQDCANMVCNHGSPLPITEDHDDGDDLHPSELVAAVWGETEEGCVAAEEEGSGGAEADGSEEPDFLARL